MRKYVPVSDTVFFNSSLLVAVKVGAVSLKCIGLRVGL